MFFVQRKTPLTTKGTMFLMQSNNNTAQLLCNNNAVQVHCLGKRGVLMYYIIILILMCASAGCVLHKALLKKE